jgi:hypothetical protein
MKNLGIICGSIALSVIIVGTALADEPSKQISRANLGNMGFGGMQSMSDAEGQSVRGTGGSFVFVHGSLGKHRLLFPFDKKFGHHDRFVHKDFGHKKVVFHGGFDHKMISHKSMGGMIWQPKQMVWNFGGPSLH